MVKFGIIIKTEKVTNKRRSTMKLYIKPFDELTNHEVYHMIRIREEIFVLEQDCVYVDCDNNDTKCDHLIVLAKDETSGNYSIENIVGTLRILPANVKYDQVSIGRVVVAKNARHQQLGSKMMKEALSFVKEKYGNVEVVLSAQVAIKGLYEKVGFKVVSDIYLEDGIDHVKMVLNG